MSFNYLPTRFQQVDASGYPIVGSKAFYRTGTSTPITIYSDRGLTSALTNPVNADSNGRFPAIWFSDANVIEGVKVVYFSEPNGTGAIVYSDDPIGPKPQAAYYEQSAIEAANGIAPVDFRYQEGDLRRYGGIGNGVAADNTAVATWLDVGQHGISLWLPEGDWNLPGWTVKELTSPVVIRGAGAGRSKLIGPGVGNSANTFVKALASVSLDGVWVDGFHYGIQVGALTSEIDVSITNCQNTRTIYFVVRVDADCNSVGVRRFRFVDNIVDHSAIPESTATRGVFIQGRYQDAVVTGNTFRHIHGRGCALGRDVYDDQDHMVRAVVSGNSFYDIAGQADAEAQAILVYGRTVSITGNVIEHVHSQHITDCEGIYTKARYGVIANNSLYNAGFNQAAINIKGSGRSGTGSPQGFGIICANNNILYDQNSGSPSRGIFVQNDDVLVIGNRIEGCDNFAIYTAGDLTLHNIMITQNRVIKCKGRIAIFMGHNGSLLRIVGNEIAEQDTPDTLTETIGILIEPESNSLDNVDIVGNTILIDDGSEATVSIRAIQVIRDAPLNNVRIAGNRLSVTNQATTFGLVISGNQTGDNWIIEDNDWSQVDGTGFAVTAGTLPARTSLSGVFELRTTGSSAIALAALPIPDGSAASLEAEIVAREHDGSDRALYHVKGLFYRAGGDATQQGATAEILTPIESDSDWSAGLGVSGNNCRVEVNGDGDTVDWRATVRLAALS